ncbi:MAG TPA: cytochrome c peroxidase [Planctomycetota bacterium]|nr:cytochrome c peroxidase [Planctomycetota bacterium]
MPFRFPLAAIVLAGTVAAQLPPPTAPAQNPPSPARIALGKVLFWEEQLSSDDSVACGTCHLPEFGGSDGRVDARVHPGPDGVFGTADDIHGSPGLARQAVNGDFTPAPGFGLRRQVTPRATPTHIAAAYASDLFWDGRASTQFVDPETNLTAIPFLGALESQAIAPILSAVEMGHEGRTWQDVRQKLQAVVPLALATALPPDTQAALQQNPTYPLLFTAAFGDPAITGARIAMAIAAYERTQVPDDTPWDRFMAGQSTAMTASEQAGWALFTGNGRCNACHWDPVFTDDQFHNLGLRPISEDPGRGAFSPVPDDQGAFKTPTLRNAGLRPRLFHNGQSAALDDPSQLTDPGSTLNIYLNGGGVDPSNIDPFLLPLNTLGVTTADMVLMQEFVRTALTDQRAALRLPPFDHPDLRSMVVAPPRIFGQGLAGAFEPYLADTVPSFAGNSGFKLGLAAGDGAGLGLLTYGFTSIEPGAVVAGLPWNLDVHGWVLFALQGQAGEPGHATWRLPIPNDRTLQLIPFYFQLLALDAQAPGGIAASPGAELFVR